MKINTNYRRLIQFAYDLIMTNKWRFCIVLLISFVIFHRPLENLFDNLIVKYVLSEIQTTWYNDLIFVFLSLISMIIFLKRFRDYTPSITTLNLSLSFFCIYLFYRIFPNHWAFVRYKFLSSFAYADLLLLMGTENLLLQIRRKVVPASIKQGVFLDDQPITAKSADLLGYKMYADQIAEKIEISQFNKAFAIGINGKWGSGKTSFVNMIKTHFAVREQIIEVEFNGWASLTPQAIIKDFFDVVLEKIGPYHSSIPRLLTRYSNKLVEFHKSNLTEVIRATTSAIGGFDTTPDLFKEINNALLKINKKIIIYIDDLDRLNKEEIVEIIRLIRNTANFSNTFFIVSYDRNYIVQALKSNNAYNPELFLEKIFQLEISLPYFDKEVLRIQLTEKLITGLSNDYKDEITKYLTGTKEVKRTPFGDWIETMRDVTRLTNSICLNVSNLLGEIELGEFILIEQLRLKYPSVYELLFAKTGQFFIPVGKRNEEVTYQLSVKKDPNQPVNTETTDLEIYLNKHSDQLSVPAYDIDRIISLVKYIFPKSSALLNIKKPPLSIVFPSKFKRYFAYTPLKENLSEIEFSKARSMSQDVFNSKIFEWYANDLKVELSNKFEQIKDYDNKDDYERVIRGLFYFCQLLINDKASSFMIDYKKVTEKLSNYKDRISDLYYTGTEGRDKQKYFVSVLFKEAKSPYLFESSLIGSIQENRYDREFFPFSMDELGVISLNYLKKYTTSNAIYNYDVLTLYWNTKVSKYEIEGDRVTFNETLIPDEARDLLKNFIFAHVDPFLVFLIDTIDKEKMLYAIKPIVDDIFRGWLNFEKELVNNNQLRSGYLEEFKEFYIALKETEFKKPVKFEFKFIQPLVNFE